MMASFLKEMKTVRLRKVSGGPPPPSIAESSRSALSSGSVRRSTSDGQGSQQHAAILRKIGMASQPLFRSTSSTSSSGAWKETEARIGDKRKRFESGHGDFQDDLRE